MWKVSFLCVCVCVFLVCKYESRWMAVEEEEGTKPIHRYIEYIPVCKYVYRLARVCNQMAGSCRVEDGEKSDEVRGRACRRCSTRRGKNKKVKPSFSIYEKKNYIGILSFKKKRGVGGSILFWRSASWKLVVYNAHVQQLLLRDGFRQTEQYSCRVMARLIIIIGPWTIEFSTQSHASHHCDLPRLSLKVRHLKFLI